MPLSHSVSGMRAGGVTTSAPRSGRVSSDRLGIVHGVLTVCPGSDGRRTGAKEEPPGSHGARTAGEERHERRPIRRLAAAAARR